MAQKPAKWNRLVDPEGYRWTGAIVLLLAVVLSWFALSDAYKWRSKSAEGVAAQDEIGAATNTCLAGFIVPAAIMAVSFIFAQHLRGTTGKVLPERIFRVQGWISLGLIIILCIRFVLSLFHIVVLADYAMPDTGAAPLLAWEESRPWQMRLVPRVQELCTSTSWMMILAFGLGLFTRQTPELTPREELLKWVESITEQPQS